MNNNRIPECRFKCNFMRYTEFIDSINSLYKDDPFKLINKLRNDLVILNNMKLSVIECLDELNKQISFVENFLDDCGVNIYEN